jgi:C_GCAxxG_C_C family probable redox protein
MNRVEKTIKEFQNGYNCAQAILATYGADYGLNRADSISLSCGFGGGMRRGNTCGAVTGSLMVLGLRFWPPDISVEAAKAKVYDKVEEFCKRFESVCSSIQCRDLIGCDLSTPEGMKSAKDNKLFETICPKMVRAAAEILEELCSKR